MPRVIYIYIYLVYHRCHVYIHTNIIIHRYIDTYTYIDTYLRPRPSLSDVVTRAHALWQRLDSPPAPASKLDDRAAGAPPASDSGEPTDSPDELTESERLFGDVALAQSSSTLENPYIRSPRESSSAPSMTSTVMSTSAMPTSSTSPTTRHNEHLVSNRVSPLRTVKGNSPVLSESSLRDDNIGSGSMKADSLFINEEFRFAVFDRGCASFCVLVFMLLFFCFLLLPRDFLVDGLVVPT